MDDATAYRETSFTLRGSASSFPDASALPLKLIRVNRAASFAPTARSVQTVQTVRVAPDDLVEIEFETGERLWMRGDDYRSRMERTRDQREADRDIVDVPIAMPLVAPGLEARDTRGAADWVVKSLKVIGIDLAGLTARAIAAIVEARPTDDGKRPGLGLFQCRLETGRFALTTPTIGEGDEPWLVFIHGTGSSTWGSFGELWSDTRRDQLSALRAAYADRALAFEHRTLTHSPIRNAVDLLSSLVRVMPAGATLHLVTHSRGGLIGELLSRPEITDEELNLFGPPASRRDDYAALSDLRSALTARAFRIERFVRVACPALGTTLASGRLDRWLSVMGTLAGFVPGTPLADTFGELGDFVAAVIKERTDPATLPGLEAMMPDSRCIALVNWPAATIDGSLAVIAGDIDPAKWWARLVVWLSDKFYEGDHDLVVNTPSMYGGARRSGRAVVSLHKTDTVNHFTYFREQRSVERLVTALTASGSGPWKGFTDLHPPAVPIARSVSRGDVARPTVFVLPGIMGSELAIGDRSIWIDLLQLARGGFADLRPDASAVRASKPVARYYGRLCEYLSSRHNVVPFAFDWRIGIEAEADRLAAAVREIVDAAQPQNQPVRFLAHSMGGLVARAMIARHPDLWRDACRHPDTRVVMLGTPNGGSHAIPEVLVGQSVVFRKLARVDVRHSAEELLSLISRFPGVLVMLPDSIEERWFSADTWQTLHARAGTGWVVPDAADLDAALATRRLIDGLPFDADRMIYVAGSADVTVAAMRIEQRPGDSRERIVFQGTTRGDGRVTWDSGIPPSLPTYFMNVGHGDLAAHDPSFPAIDDLLTVGETRLLPRTPPVTRAAAVLFDMPPAEDDRYPDEDDLVAAALGAAVRARRETRDPDAAVHVSVVHGNLAFARHPVAVGHYFGDTIVSAEKHLDRALQFALSRRLHLGLYPGPIETSAVFSNARLRTDPYARPAGAIVVGLGTVGSLTASTLTRSFSRALLEFVLGDANDARPRDPGSIGISTLLIGTGAGGMSVTDSVFALLRGAQRANQELAAAGEKARISRLEFIELYQDRAILALEALDRLWRRAGPETTFVLDDSLRTRDGGLQRITYDEEPEWWQRLQIQGERVGEEAAALRFASVTRRARAEVRLLPTQRRLVDEFVQRSLAGTRRDQSIGRTLFDLLLPNELKEMAPDQDNLMLLLDEDAARYPWELLDNREDRTRGPFAVEHGLLRQLEAREFREIVRATVERTALVIGDPVSPFVELKGAQDEAEAVWLVLQQGFTVTKKVRPAAHEVITALFERAYKVLHLAGHGVYRVALPGRPAPVTGMVIGDGVLLTPAEVAQMRSVPDLVFVNCCHLGRIERDTTDATPQELAFPDLAANLAAEFIGMGVRCVIAAGWAVDDGAALTFATAFYREMLDGESFGDAVTRARAATYANHPGSNTWGAYQCYGDPDFRLVLRGEQLRQADEEPRFLSPAHALRDLGNITARLKTRSSMGSEAEATFLEAIVKVLAKKKWLSSGAINAALGRAYGEAGELERASEYYCAALASEDGAVTARDVEQWANLVSRIALVRAREHPDDDAVRQEAVRNVRRAITVLKGLLGGAKRDRATSERLALLGSAYKRLAWIDPERRGDALARMAESYAIAAETARERGGDAAYPLINARWAQLVMRWQDGRGDPDPLPELPSDLAAIRASLDAREASDGPQFWQDSMRVDCDLLEAMASGAPRPDQLDAIAEHYVARLAHASPRELASVSDQFDFLITMADRLRDVADALAAVRQKITQPPE